jgi:hypothetical protein
VRVQSVNPFVLIFATACLLFGTAVQALEEFSVALSITVSGATSGSGSGSGTATLDTGTGVLTMNLNSQTSTGFTDTSVVTIATVNGSYSPDSLSSVSGNSQLISCTNNGGLVNGCNSITSDFGTDFLTDPINFDLALNGLTTFTVTDTNTGAVITQTFTLTTGGTPPPGPPATIDLTSGGPTQYIFDPGDGSSVTLNITANSGSVTQGSSGLGNDTGFADDGAIDNYAVGSSKETLIFTFSQPVVLDAVHMDLFEPIATNERAELVLDGGGVTTIDENNATRTGGDLSNWEYIVDAEVTVFTLGSPARSGIIGDTTFRANSLVVSAVPPVDSDNDGLFDNVETNTGIFIDANDTGSDPGDSDTDDDGVSDGDEVAAGTDPNVSQRPCDVDPVAGLTAGDLLLMQQHLSGLIILSTNEQVFCDIDNDSDVTLSDMLLLQQDLLTP